MGAEGVPRRIRAFDEASIVFRLRQTEPFNHNNSRSKTGEYGKRPERKGICVFLALGSTNTYTEIFKPMILNFYRVV